MLAVETNISETSWEVTLSPKDYYSTNTLEEKREKRKMKGMGIL